MNASIGEIGSTDINSNYSILAVLVNTKTDTDFYNKSLTKNGIRLSDYAIEKKAEVKVTRKW